MSTLNCIQFYPRWQCLEKKKIAKGFYVNLSSLFCFGRGKGKKNRHVKSVTNLTPSQNVKSISIFKKNNIVFFYFTFLRFTCILMLYVLENRRENNENLNTCKSN